MKTPISFRWVSAAAALAVLPSAARADWVTTNGPAAVQTRAFDASPGKLLAATSGGVFVSSNYTSWSALSSGLSNTNVSSLARSVHVSGTLLAGTLGGGVFWSMNEGASWAPANTGLTSSTIRALTAVPDGYVGTVYFAGTDAGVFRSNAWGTTWMQVNGGLTNTQVRAFTFYFEGSDENDGIGAHDLLVGTNGGGVFRSDMGTTWVAKNTGLTNLDVRALAASSSYAVTFAGTNGGGVFRSTSIWGGWTAINSGLTHTTIQALVAKGTKLFAGTPAGVFVSSNDGASGWSSANAGLTQLDIAALAADATHLYAATGDGVFRRALSEM